MRQIRSKHLNQLNFATPNHRSLWSHTTFLIWGLLVIFCRHILVVLRMHRGLKTVSLLGYFHPQVTLLSHAARPTLTLQCKLYLRLVSRCQVDATDILSGHKAVKHHVKALYMMQDHLVTGNCLINETFLIDPTSPSPGPVLTLSLSNPVMAI